MDFNNMTDKELRVELKKALARAENGIFDACVILKHMRQPPKNLPEPLPRFMEIADGKLSAHAAWLLWSVPGALDCLSGLDHSLQNEIADGKEIPVAVRKNGRIMSDAKQIYVMSQAEMRLAFDPDGLTPIDEQQKWLLSQAPRRPLPRLKPAVRADVATGEIIVNRTHVSITDLTEALAVLGYKLAPIYTPAERKKLAHAS